MFNDGGGTTLFVGDLASFCDEKHIQEVFTEHGFEVVDVKLMRGKQSMSTLNYGFVQLRSNADAMKAIAVLDSKLIHGRKLRVNWAQPNMKVSRPSESNNSVYVKFQALTVCI
jgi:RNA recognition motif-containing protein